MRAAVVPGFGQPLVIEDRPVPAPTWPTSSPCTRPAGTRVSYETRPLTHVNEAISEVLHGKAKARLVLEP